METFEANNNYEEVPLVDTPRRSSPRIHHRGPLIDINDAPETADDELDGDATDGKIGLRLQPRGKELSSKGILDDGFLCARRMVSPVLLILIVVLLGVELVYFVLWMRLFDYISSTMPKTFAWFILLPPFGSVYHHQSCSGSCRADMVTRPQEFTPVGSSPPIVPILAMTFTGILISVNLVFLWFKSCRKTALFYMKQLVFVVGVFTSLVLAISGSLLYRGVSKLDEIMEEELHVSVASMNETLRWFATQQKNGCCGSYSPADWQIAGFKGFPYSCCTHNLEHGAQLCHGTGPNKLHWRGCYDLERNKAVVGGRDLICMIVLLFAFTLATFFLNKKYHMSHKEHSALLDQGTVHRVFMRQGSNFITLGGQNGYQHVIRKGVFMVETKGALASSSAINDHHISLEILNFSHTDTVGITRETDRILISVNCTNTKAVRGKAIVTSMDERNLEKVVITPTASGIINIFV